MRRRQVLLAAGTVGTSAVSGCTELPALFQPEFDIGMSANEFQPYEFEVTAGTTVTWYNDGSRAHTVTAYDGGIPDDAAYFASGGYEDEMTAREEWETSEGGNIYSGELYEHTFETPGYHLYFCVPHEPGQMLGAVIVEPAEESSSDDGTN